MNIRPDALMKFVVDFVCRVVADASTPAAHATGTASATSDPLYMQPKTGIALKEGEVYTLIGPSYEYKRYLKHKGARALLQKVWAIRDTHSRCIQLYERELVLRSAAAAQERVKSPTDLKTELPLLFPTLDLRTDAPSLSKTTRALDQDVREQPAGDDYVCGEDGFPDLVPAHESSTAAAAAAAGGGGPLRTPASSGDEPDVAPDESSLVAPSAVPIPAATVGSPLAESGQQTEDRETQLEEAIVMAFEDAAVYPLGAAMYQADGYVSFRFYPV